MRKFITVFMVGAAMALTACAATDGESDYSYETQAPYADERTVGDEGAESAGAERVFQRRQRK